MADLHGIWARAYDFERLIIRAAMARDPDRTRETPINAPSYYSQSMLLGFLMAYSYFFMAK
jgi:hypothetical protein